MREILFRGKRIDNGLWIEGCLRQYPNGKAGICCNEIQHTFMVDPDTVGQYTGLKDKNGKRIFEGDIVLPVLPDRVAQRGFVWPKMPVAFEDGEFALLDSHGSIPLRSFAPTVTFEVVGNIHDNPELLKEE